MCKVKDKKDGRRRRGRRKRGRRAGNRKRGRGKRGRQAPCTHALHHSTPALRSIIFILQRGK